MDLRRPLDVITPTLDAEVLTVLASRPGYEVTTGDVQRLVERRFGETRSLPGIRRTLQRLAGQGVVAFRRAGRVGVYWLDHEHIAAGLVIDLARLREQLVERVARRVREWSVQPVFGAVLDEPPTCGSDAGSAAARPDAIHVLLVPPVIDRGDVFEGGDGPARGDGLDGERWDLAVGGLVEDVHAWTGSDVVVHEIGVGRLQGMNAWTVLRAAELDGETFVGESHHARAFVGEVDLTRAAVREFAGGELGELRQEPGA